MKKKTLYAGLVGLLLLTANLRISTAQIRQRHQNLSIFNNLEMADSTRIIADSSINLTLLKKEYRLEKPLWDKALAYLKVTRLDTLAPGRYPIAGDSLYALVTENQLKEPAA